MTSDSHWNHAVIASRGHITLFHQFDNGLISRFAGETIRIRPCSNLRKLLDLAVIHRSVLECNANTFVEVHPEDAKRLWPEDVNDQDLIVLCEYCFFTD
jgi:hypothetical protein